MYVRRYLAHRSLITRAHLVSPPVRMYDPRLQYAGEILNFGIHLLVDGTVRHAGDAFFACYFVDACGGGRGVSVGSFFLFFVFVGGGWTEDGNGDFGGLEGRRV